MTPPRESRTAALVNDLAVATTECTALMNEQFLALVANDPDIGRFNGKIGEAIERRRAVMEELLSQIKISGW
jgi:hypothetical protein